MRQNKEIKLNCSSIQGVNKSDSGKKDAKTENIYKTDSGLLPHHVLVIISHIITQLLCKTPSVKIMMPSSDERPDSINIFGLALSEGRRGGG